MATKDSLLNSFNQEPAFLDFNKKHSLISCPGSFMIFFLKNKQKSCEKINKLMISWILMIFFLPTICKHYNGQASFYYMSMLGREWLGVLT